MLKEVPIDSNSSYYHCPLSPYFDFTHSIHKEKLMITLKEETVTSLQLQPGDQFEVTLGRIGDYAYNMISDEVIIVEVQ
ncbi:hypothetical protein ACE3MQ_10985 [Paenibacillus lentus]